MPTKQELEEQLAELRERLNSLQVELEVARAEATERRENQRDFEERLERETACARRAEREATEKEWVCLKMAMMEAELAACHDKEGLRLSLERTHEWEIPTHLELRSVLEKHLADKEAELETALERFVVHSGKVERSYAGVNRGSVHSGNDSLHGSGAQEVSEYGGSVPGSSEPESGLIGGSEQDESVCA